MVLDLLLSDFRATGAFRLEDRELGLHTCVTYFGAIKQVRLGAHPIVPFVDRN